MTAAVTPVSTNCAACGLGLLNDIDARAGLDQSCRAQLDYRHISSLAEAAHAEAATLIHTIAQDLYRGDALRTAIFRLYELGFVRMSQRIARRVGVATREINEQSATATQTVEQLIESGEAEPADFDMPPSEVLRPLPFSPTNDQGRALEATRRMMARNKHGVTVVVGYAGTGKTALIQFVAHAFGSPACIAPTGKAALRIRESTGLDASTIHSLIYIPIEDPKTGLIQFVRRTAEEVEMFLPRSRLLVLDEASMVGPEVWLDVIAVAKQHDLRLLVIGDGFQLPPVQGKNAPPFSVLTPEFSQQLGAERVEMTEVLRQAKDSPIIRASMALRTGTGTRALDEIYKVPYNDIANICLRVHQQGGVTICHRNVTRHGLNNGIRQMLGITDDMPQVGEPLLVLKNDPILGLVNGETIEFPGWSTQPEQPEVVVDRWQRDAAGQDLKEMARFGAVKVNDKLLAVVAVEELHGKLKSSMKAVSISAAKWARMMHVFNGEKGTVPPHLAANFGYAYTAHKSQGSQWPYVFVVIETSVRLNEEEGRRWVYTSITRGSEFVGVFFGNIW